MRHPLRLTNSEMKGYRRCKRAWYLGTYLGWGKRSRDFNRPLAIGSRVHNALAVLYDPNEPQSALDFLKESVRKDLAQYPSEANAIRKEADLSEAMIEGYEQWLEETGADRGFQIVETEGAREAVLYEDVTLLSKLDARLIHTERADIRLALEHKTTGDLSVALPFLQLDTQLLTEHLVEYLCLQREGLEAQSAQGVLYNMLRKSKRTSRAKPPFYAREEVRHNRHELAKHWEHVVGIAQEIRETEAKLDAGVSHHQACSPNPTRDCKWDCPFFHMCSHLDDGSDWEQDLRTDFVQGDPLERYAKTEGGIDLEALAASVQIPSTQS